MALTLVQLTYFLAAVKRGTLSGAAESLDVAQPSVSEQIAKLERHLGTPLFIRGNRRLVLTAAGVKLKPHAEQILGSVDKAESAVNDIRTLADGAVEFGTFSSAQHYLLTALVTEFRRKHPNVSVRIVGNNSAEVADAVRRGDLEAGLVALPIDDRSLTVGRTVWTCEVIYCHVDPEMVREPATVERICASPLVLPEARWGDADPTRRRLILEAQRTGQALRPQIEVESPAAAQDIAARGIAGTVAALPLVRMLGLTNRLHTVSLNPPLQETFAFITRHDGHVSPATQELIALATKQLRRVHREHAAPTPPRRCSADQ